MLQNDYKVKIRFHTNILLIPMNPRRKKRITGQLGGRPLDSQPWELRGVIPIIVGSHWKCEFPALFLAQNEKSNLILR